MPFEESQARLSCPVCVFPWTLMLRFPSAQRQTQTQTQTHTHARTHTHTHTHRPFPSPHVPTPHIPTHLTPDEEGLCLGAELSGARGQGPGAACRLPGAPRRGCFCSWARVGKHGHTFETIAVLFGCFARKIAWFTWWFNHLPGPSISPKRTPMVQTRNRCLLWQLEPQANLQHQNAPKVCVAGTSNYPSWKHTPKFRRYVRLPGLI